MAGLRDRHTRLAGAAGVDRWLVSLSVLADAVERARDDAGCRCFSDAADAGQHEGVRDAARGKGVRQSANECFLTDQAGKILRTIFAREYPIGLAPRRRCRAEAQGWFLRLVHAREPGSE